MGLSLRMGICLGRGTSRMTLLLQFLAVFSILFLCYFHVFREKEPQRRKTSRFAAVFHSPAQRSVTRSEWKKGHY